MKALDGTLCVFAFFIRYWGLSLTFDIGFWGYELGWYTGQVPS